ncbi:MAG: hypothetical protein ORN85_02270, partial [Sediminibacterium sp.]|nr:hypothetical protein [Sediminibacterium sp.]
MKNRFFKIIIAFVLLLVSNIKGESQTFTISTTVRNGTITADTTVSTGTNGRITYLANSGYYLDSIFIKNVYDSAISVDSTNGFTFNNISANDTIKVVFSPYFNISTSTNGNGTISSSVNNIKRGGYSNITYQPSSGYRLDSVLINNINRGKDSMTSYTFYNIQANNVIRAFFSMIPPDTLTVNIITEMTSTQNFVIPYGADYRYTYQTPSGYKLDSIIVNNMNKGTDSSIGYTFYNVTSNI